MKANANPVVVQHLARLGSGFEIASMAELQLALDAGVDGKRIICSNPIKHPHFIARMQDVGVYAMVVDSTFELEKVARYAPGARVYVRLAVDNTGSVLPLAGKFGVDAATAVDLCDQARALGLEPIGTMFHVGSQCLAPANWVNAIRAAAEVWRMAAEHGHNFHFLDLGGGYPAGHYHTPSIPTVEDIGADVMAAIATYLPQRDDLMLVVEPGRGMVGESGRLLSAVFGKAERGDQTWLYLDAGVFNGLMETYEGFPPVVSHLDDAALVRPLRTYTLAGPSCDSCDVIARDVVLPEVQIGDRLVFFDAGAYTNEYAAAFNGFPIPAFVPLLPGEQETRVGEAIYDLVPG
ncbi:MAG: type III PLP-dependent enzyme [Anaerolineae bacterium]|nr:type III PLP-dependent enzyme [Anaerolineae bacterium]